ncbi:MAG TPA: SDR family oxidoreductase [Segeticoccus sp.]|nr:SDR family oxidoreductase [Segeticoccus sp.]
MAAPGAAPVAVVTGAGSGIGRAIALGLVRAGHRVGLLARRAETLEAVAQEAALVPGAITLVLPTDVTSEQQVSAAFAQVRQEWGRVDLLVNNAGTFGPAGEPDGIDVDAWRATIDVNLTGAFLCAREAFALMRSQDPRGGRILNNGSISAHTPRPGGAAYTASKHALTGLTKSLALDGRIHDIACGQVDIGNAATPLTEEISRGALQADGSRRPEPTFDVERVADLVVEIAALPLGVNVPFFTMTATGMPYLGRG